MRALIILVLGATVTAAIFAVRWSVQHGAKADTQTVLPDESKAARPRALDAVQSLKHGDPLPDALLVDQDGHEFHLSDLKGKVLALTFIYTHCNQAAMCPMATAKLVEVQDAVRKRGLSGVQFLVISFDFERDSPEQLKKYASSYGPDLSSFRFATGRADEIGPLARKFNTYYRQTAPGVFEHNIVISLVDRQGILRDDFFGTAWETNELVNALAEVGR